MLMRTDPFRELDRFAQQVFGTPSRPASVPIDAFRRGEEFIVEIDVPGVDPESIDVTVEKNVLSIHAERSRSAGDDVEMLLAERPQGTFTRQLFLGESLDVDRLEASCANGVLRLRIPVAEKAKPRRVSVSSGDSESTPIEAHSTERVAVNA